MTSYDDDLPTQQESILLKKLIENDEDQQRIYTITEVNETKS